MSRLAAVLRMRLVSSMLPSIVLAALAIEPIPVTVSESSVWSTVADADRSSGFCPVSVARALRSTANPLIGSVTERPTIAIKRYSLLSRRRRFIALASRIEHVCRPAHSRVCSETKTDSTGALPALIVSVCTCVTSAVTVRPELSSHVIEALASVEGAHAASVSPSARAA